MQVWKFDEPHLKSHLQCHQILYVASLFFGKLALSIVVITLFDTVMKPVSEILKESQVVS